MQVSTLTRDRVDWKSYDIDRDVSDDEVGNEELASQAESALGYAVPARQHRRAKRQRSLRETFDQLDVRPFTSDSVDRYKAAAIRKMNRPLALVTKESWELGVFGIFCPLPLLVAFTLLGYANLAFAAAMVCTVSTVVVCVSSYLLARCFREREWKMHPLAAYAERVPEFVLQTAVDVKAWHPEAEFFICALEEKRVIVDPFLVLRVGAGDDQQDFYLEVWNENRFQAEREA